MIISPKYKFVFFATEKTGCTSVQNCLANLNDKNLIVGEVVPKDVDNLLLSKHTSCDEFTDRHLEYNHFFKIAFVRNPWDRVVSWYMFSKSLENPDQSRDLTSIGFKEYIKKFGNIWSNEQQDQYKFVGCCDFIGRFENLQEDFNSVCDKIGIPRQQLPYRNKTRHKHHTKYYTDETREIVAERFANDIEYFGYKFGE
jgi:chondroitin 4-sulfotransferase 11